MMHLYEKKVPKYNEGHVKSHCHYFLSHVLVTMLQSNWSRLSVRLLPQPPLVTGRTGLHDNAASADA